MTIVGHSYGKAGVRVLKVVRAGAQHELRDLVVSIRLSGPFEAAYTNGDNRNVVPTDTMKNAVYALGRDHPIDTIEAFALHLGRHFVDRHEHVDGAEVEVAAYPWTRATAHTFMRGGPESDVCEVLVDTDDTTITSGIDDLTMLKTTGSAFRDFLHDELTTLKDTDDRILGTALTARWEFAPAATDYIAARTAIRKTLIAVFADHQSLSVQHTLHAMGTAALDSCPAITRIALSMPNKHCLLVDLEPFGRANDNEIFMPVDEPFGVIEAIIERSHVSRGSSRTRAGGSRRP